MRCVFPIKCHLQFWKECSEKAEVMKVTLSIQPIQSVWMKETTVRLLLELETRPGAWWHTCNPSTSEAETRGLQVLGKPQQFSNTLSNLASPCFKSKKDKKGLGV